MLSFGTIVKIILLIVSFIMMLITEMKHKLAKPEYKTNIQRPGSFITFFHRLLLVQSVILAVLTIVMTLAGETEASLVFAVVTFFSTILTAGIKRKYDMTYQEKEDYFILTIKKQQVKVCYEDISHFQLGLQNIWLQDKTKPNQEFIGVNLALFKPEILIRTLTEMTINGQFPHVEGVYPDNSVYPDDPLRKKELTGFLIRHRYDYLIEDYIKQMKSQQV